MGVVAATARTMETDASEGIEEEIIKADDAFDGDPLTYEAPEENDNVEEAVSDCAVVERMLLDSEMVLEAASELAELASVPSAKLAATLTVEVSYVM